MTASPPPWLTLPPLLSFPSLSLYVGSNSSPSRLDAHKHFSDWVLSGQREHGNMERWDIVRTVAGTVSRDRLPCTVLYCTSTTQLFGGVLSIHSSIHSIHPSIPSIHPSIYLSIPFRGNHPSFDGDPCGCGCGVVLWYWLYKPISLSLIPIPYSC